MPKPETHFIRRYYPWIIFLLSSSFFFYKYLLQVSPSVMTSELMQAFSLSGLQMGNLAAFYFYTYLIMQLPAGLLIDRYSPKKLMTLAILICATGGLVFAKAPGLGTAEFGRLLVGLGGAAAVIGTSKFISLWFKPEKFALISGFMMTLGMLGAVCAQAPLTLLMNHFSWRSSAMILAIIGYGIAILFLLIARDKAISDEPIKTTVKKPAVLKGLLAIMKNRHSWLIALYSGLAFAPISAFGGLWGVPYLMRVYPTLDKTTIAALTSLIFIGFAVGSPLAGWFSDRIKRRNPVMAVGTLLSMIAIIIVLYVPHLSEFTLGAMLFCMGFFTGFFFVSFATIREMNDTRLSATSIGFINMFNALCGAFSEPLIGKLLDQGWNHITRHGVRIFSIHDYHVALLTLPICLCVALIALFFTKETFCQNQINNSH